MNNNFFSGFQLAYCRVARESATTANPIAEIAKTANETWGQIHDALLRIAGVSSDTELWTKTQDGFKSFSETLQSSVNQINEEVSLERISWKSNDIYVKSQLKTHFFFWNHLDQTIARKGWGISQGLHQQSHWSRKRIESQEPRLVQRRSS